MINHLSRFFQFYLLLLLWSLSSVFFGSIASVVVGLSLLLFWKNQRNLELLLGFIFILILSDNISEVFTFAKSFKYIYIIFLFIILTINRERFIPYSSFHKGFIPFIIVAFIALMYAGNFNVSLMKTFSYFFLIMIVPNYLRRAYKENGVQAIKDMVYFLFVMLFVCLVVAYFFNKFSFIEFRLRGLFGNPNGLGIYIFLVYLFFFIVNKIWPDLFPRREKFILYILLFYTLFLTNSRTAILSILILLLFTRLYKLSPYLGFLILIVSSVGIELIFMNMVKIVQSVGLDEYFRLHTLEEGSGRFVAWSFAWHKIQDFFFIGGSFGNDEFIMRQNYALLTQLGHQGGVHNSYLTLWFDVGLVGIVLYFFNFLKIFLNSSRYFKYSFPVLFSILFCITYESWLAGSLNPFTIILFSCMTLLSDYDFFTGQENPDENTFEENNNPVPAT